jgi:hypothetical protein
MFVFNIILNESCNKISLAMARTTYPHVAQHGARSAPGWPASVALAGRSGAPGRAVAGEPPAKRGLFTVQNGDIMDK